MKREETTSEEYLDLRYMLSDTDCYINTGFVPSSNNIVIECDYYCETASETIYFALFGNLPSNYASIRHFGIGAAQRYNHTQHGNKMNVMMGSTEANVLNSNMALDTWRHLVLTSNGSSWTLNVDGSTYSGYNYYQLSATNTPILLFAVQNFSSTGLKGSRISSFKLTQNNVLQLNLIPWLRLGDNEPGLYNLVDDTFLTNASTGTFLYN